MTRFKELARIGTAIEYRNVADLRWALGYSKMRIVYIVLRAIAIFSLLGIPSIAQQKPYVVKLVVMHDRQERPAPDQIIFIFGDRSIPIPIREGRFEVPPELVGSKEFAVSADIGDDHIEVSGLTRMSLIREYWRLYLAEYSYGTEYQWMVPQGAKVYKTCILSFDSLSASGYFIFAEHGRSRRK
jgi:hypothetical protein